MRENREKNDLVTKNFEIFPDVAADIINALLHNGKLVVTKENLLPAPTESIYTSGENRLRNQLQDVVKYEMAGERIRAQYMIANQSAPDVKMVLRKAGYTGGGYREQYEGKVMDMYPIIEMILYWGREHWEKQPGIHELCCGKVPEELRKYVDDIRVHIWEMRYLPQEVRERFHSDMRIVLDYLAEGNNLRSDQKVVHKAALIRMINAALCTAFWSERRLALCQIIQHNSHIAMKSPPHLLGQVTHFPDMYPNIIHIFSKFFRHFSTT